MSIGKNIKVGGAKKSEKPKKEMPQSKDKAKPESSPALGDESVKKTELLKTENEKLQKINESVAAVVADPVAVQRQEASSPMISEGQNMLIVFPVGDEEYAIAIDDIKEVVSTPPIAIIPQVPFYILGVANVRGNVLAVIDLAKKFSTEGQGEVEKKGKFVLVIKSEEMQVAVNVINVPNTMIVKDSEVDAPTNVISHSNLGMNHIKGIIKRDKRMIIWIDIHEVMSQMQMDDLE
ncbi:MAG: purine-binding chemotaxis protein CheW [Reichenbachiella sp.]